MPEGVTFVCGLKLDLTAVVAYLIAVFGGPLFKNMMQRVAIV